MVTVHSFTGLCRHSRHWGALVTKTSEILALGGLRSTVSLQNLHWELGLPGVFDRRILKGTLQNLPEGKTPSV